ncbi:major facilitator superfamily domain-containing protein [Zychaea mexicana]|uniref:major facilitator superfamily domain-containing protein n=1 Tax=Zychaea mexicana TaxID=64656 RepID=UPI0022FE0571|nr:major facilitator superfamily domain-containing protein [Zychaea mexicana]KAI9493877.1 major facilitator superfamily domain-containing protein [Zychaea mexicana]
MKEKSIALGHQTEEDRLNHAASNNEGFKVAKVNYSPEEKKLLRKINLTTAPFILIIIFLQFLDKTALNFSAVLGLFDDTAITESEFGWLGSIFFIGYLLFQIPCQYLLQQLPISKFLGVFLVLWGTVTACESLARNFSQLLGLRFLQGFLEGAAHPCIQLLFSTIYRRNEQLTWFGALVATNSFGFAIGGIIGFGFTNIDDLYGLSGWKWCMIILGSATATVGILTFLFLPDTPKSKWYRLKPEENDIVEERLRDNKMVHDTWIKWDQILEALGEFRFYCYFLICYLMNTLNGCITFFSTLIIKSMGFSNGSSVLFNIPAGCSSVIITVIAIYFSHRFNENGYVGAICCFVPFIGLLLLILLPTGGVLLMGLCLTTAAPVYALALSMISNNVIGSTKKIFYNGAYFVAYCLGNFTGPLMMRSEEAPRYTSSLIGYMIAVIISALLFLYLRWTYARDNRYRLRLKREERNLSPSSSRIIPAHQRPSISNQNNRGNQEAAVVDLTDRQNLNLLYRP